jgi:O-acetyl-ADP-ribose deacetylase (regulator of RNase III)
MTTIRAIRDDITKLTTDAIVNAANRALLGGGGVDGAIHRAAGPELLHACKALPVVRAGVRCETGDARITPGFRLSARYVIHTVGPVFGEHAGDEDRLLAGCHARSLALAVEQGLKSVAFPAISCGVYGYPKRRAARVGVAALREFVDGESGLEEIVLVACDVEMWGFWEAELGVN